MNKLYLLFVILFSQTVVAQNSKLSLGAGFPDLTFASYSFTSNDTNEFTFQLGYLQNAGRNFLIAPAVEHKYSFSHSKKYTSSGTWFFGQRLNYLYQFTPNEYEFHLLSLNFSIGRRFYFTELYGLSLDWGLFIKMFEKETDLNITFEERFEPEPGPEEDLFPEFLPNLRIQFFRRF